MVTGPLAYTFSSAFKLTLGHLVFLVDGNVNGYSLHVSFSVNSQTIVIAHVYLLFHVPYLINTTLLVLNL